MQAKKEMQPATMEQEKRGVELPKQIEVQPETESWMQKIEKRFARVPNKTQDITDDSVVVQDQASGQPPVTLPVTSAQVAAGKKAPVEEGIAWFITWVVRQWKQITKRGGRVRLQDLPEYKE